MYTRSRGRLESERRSMSLRIAAVALFGLTVALVSAGAQSTASSGSAQATQTELAHPGFLVSVSRLKQEIGSPNLVIVDARELVDYRAGHIAGAVSMPLSELQEDRLLPDGNISPAMVKPPVEITEPLQEAGINKNSHIVFYDNNQTYLATREWWMLDYYGHADISVLDGGLGAWKAAGGAISTTTTIPPAGNFVPVADSSKIATYAYVQAHAGTTATAFCDALSASSYAAGAIKGSINLPWTSTIDQNAFGELKGASVLASLFQSLHLSKDQEIVFYCQRGYVSSLEYFVARALGYTHVRLYDGSISDYTAQGGTLVPSGGK